jgi:hypothetical protein
MLTKLIALLLLMGSVLAVSAQDPEEQTVNATAQKDSLNAQRKAWNQENTIYKPIIGIGTGVFNYIGEVNNNDRTNPLVNNYGIQVSVIKNFSPSWGLRFDVAYGRMSAREQRPNVFRNFSSEVVTFNLHATYSFAGLLRPGRFLNPYLSVGVGAINFDAKGDLKDANGVTYVPWSDGTLRSSAEPESGPNTVGSPAPLRADYVYETDLRKANLDSLGEYAQFAFAIPLTFGINFRVSPRSIIRLSSTFSYAFTDLIDNYTYMGVEGRKGDKINDMFLFTAVSYHFDFFTSKKVKKSKYDDMEFASLEGDSDSDGVSDLLDQCPNTPEGANVDENGCPLDSDMDGVYDYADEEPNTDPNLNVNEKGVGITDDMTSLSEEDTLATIRAKMFEVYPDMSLVYKSTHTSGKDSIQKKFSEVHHWLVDNDDDRNVTIEEIYEAIDHFFEGQLHVSVAFMKNLIDSWRMKSKSNNLPSNKK